MEIHTKGNEERPKRETATEMEEENGKTKKEGAKKGKIRKAQIFARINGDDDRWKTKRHRKNNNKQQQKGEQNDEEPQKIKERKPRKKRKSLLM